MTNVVELYRDAAKREGRDRFSCPVPVWELLRELGETFGWQPKGTTYIVPPRRKVEAPARRNYQPGDVLDHKQVETEDAVAWAHALQMAKDSPHFPAMIEARAAAIADRGEAADADALQPGLIEEFIAFAYGGAFTFAISADADTDSQP